MEIIGYMIMTLVFLIPIILIALIISAIVKRNNGKDGKEIDFDKIIRTIYTYIVLISSLFLVVFAIIGIFNNAIGYFIPEDTYTNQNQNLVWLITTIAELVVALPIFIYHSKLARKI